MDISSIDFQLLGSGLLSLQQIREVDLEGLSSSRPWTLDELEDTLDHVARLKGVGLPLGRLKRLHHGLLNGKMQAMLDYCHMLTRVTDRQRRYLITHFPGTGEGFLDLVPELLELYDFVPEKEWSL